MAEIGKRKYVLDLGCGYGFIIPELKTRSSGMVIGVDQSFSALNALTTKSTVVCADASSLAFKNQVFDLVFSQNLLLWTSSPEAVARQVSRILMSGGVWVLFEPDYGGLMEYPPELETRSLWIQALKAAGGNPFIGRELPSLLHILGFSIRVEFLPRHYSPQSERFDFLSELPLSPDAAKSLNEIRRRSKEIDSLKQVAHLPYYLIIAERS